MVRDILQKRQMNMRINIDPEIVKKSFDAVKSDASFTESRSLQEKGLPVVEMLQAIAMRPEIMESFATFGKGIYPGGLIPRALKEKIILKASILNECQFCASSHISKMRRLGISDNPVVSVENPELLTPVEKIVLQYTEVVTKDSNRVTDELFASLREHFTDPEIVEITFVIGFINMLNRFNNALGIRYNDDYDRPH
jgi:uncharacterized peroxidase-related enzyme